MIFILIILSVIISLALTFIVGITIQGKMARGMSKPQAWKELFKEVFL